MMRQEGNVFRRIRAKSSLTQADEIIH